MSIKHKMKRKLMGALVAFSLIGFVVFALLTYRYWPNSKTEEIADMSILVDSTVPAPPMNPTTLLIGHVYHHQRFLW